MIKPYYIDENVTIYHGDCREIVPTLGQVDAVVTDPPYGLRFMSAAWDYDVPSVDLWRVIFEALKPGAHLLAFAGTRTQHRMAVNIEDAGFEIRDMIAWVYGSGFPKSLDVSKAIDKAAGAEREVVGHNTYTNQDIRGGGYESEKARIKERLPSNITAPATDAAREWQGWGTALKPALEPITVARKPFPGTVAANVLEHGTGAINVDGCRVETGESTVRPLGHNAYQNGQLLGEQCGGRAAVQVSGGTSGRWPANLIHDGSDEVVGLFPVTKSGGGDRNGAQKGDVFHGVGDTGTPRPFAASSGSAARFFYQAKCSKKDRDEGCEGLEAQNNMRVNGPRENEEAKHATKRANHHPTVKPTDLMRYLCRLVTPPGGVVLDPFMGSGSTGKAAVLEGFGFIGIEIEEEYCEVAAKRMQNQPG